MPEEPGWLTAAETARRLGVTTQAVHGRIRRGTLDARRDNRGRLLVLVTNGDGVSDTNSAVALRERVARLEERLAAAEAVRADRDRELAEVKAERDRLLALLEACRWPGLLPALRCLLWG